MPKLEITFADGRSESRRLSRRNPIVVGRNPISDVHVEDDSVAPIHCRVHWNGTDFEIAATSDEGVDVNGTLVKRKSLAVGDVIRVGDADMLMTSSRGGRGEETRARREKSPAVAFVPADDAETDGNRQTQELSEVDWGVLAGSEEPSEAVEFAEAPPPTATPDDEEPDDQPPEPEVDAQPVVLDDQPDTPAAKREDPPSPAKPPSWSRLRSAKRPGEQDVLTSPLVLGLGGLALALLLAAGAIWLLIGRENADRLYEAARDNRAAGKYTQAIAGFEKFLLEYPTDSRVPEARRALGLTRIERHANGAAPDFEKALAAFDDFVRAERDAPDFQTLAPALAETAQNIASGASAAAIRTGDRAYLDPAEQAGKLFARYAGEGPRVEETKSRLAAEFAQAQAAVRKQEYFEEIAATVESAIATNDFIAVYQAREDLLARYPEFRDNRRLRELLAQALEAERALIQPVAEPTTAVKLVATTENEPRPSVMLMGHTQARVGEVSDGRLVVAVARDQLVGLDVVTGRPVWRTTVGLNTPFFPVEVDASVPALLAFDAARMDLLLLARETGEPIWRTHIGRLAGGPPHIGQGQIDLATTDGHLVRIGLENGEPLASLAFPQPLVGTPIVTDDGEHLVIFGEQSTAYVLDLRTLEVRGVSFVGHSAGSLATSPQRLGRLLVVFENDQLESAMIRALAFDPESASLKPVAAERVPGTIRVPPMPRGNVLFVPSSMERITAFSVSDDPGQPPLTRLAGVQITNPRDVFTFLVPGPDGMLWAAGSALRKLKLVAEDLSILPGELAPGRHQQPVQESGEGLFVARTLPASKAIYVSQADRESMTGSWRCVLGASIIAHARTERETTFVTEAGQIGIVAPDDLERAGFLNTTPLPEWDKTAAAPLRGASLSNGVGLVWQAGEPARLWRIDPTATVAAPRDLPAAPQTAPIALTGGLVLPLPGRLEWLAEANGAAVDPFLLPVTGDQESVPEWQSLVALDEETFAALTEDGTLRVLRRRDEPRPYLAEIASADLPDARPGRLAAFGGDLLVAIDNRLEKRDPAGLRPAAAREFSEPIQGGPWVVGSLVLVRTERGQVIALDAANLEERWRLSMKAPLAAAPMPLEEETENPAWLLAGQNGTLVIVENDGVERARITLPRRLTGLARVANEPVALTIDGSVVGVGLNVDR